MQKKLIELRRCHTYVDVKLTRVYVNKKKIRERERERKNANENDECVRSLN